MNYSSCLHQWIKVISPNIVNDLYPFEEILWNEKKFLGQGLKEFPPPTPLLHFRNQCACRSTSYILVQAWSIKFADSHLIQCKVRCSYAATVFIYIVVLKFKLTLSRNDHYFIINLTWISTGLSLFVLFFLSFFSNCTQTLVITCINWYELFTSQFTTAQIQASECIVMFQHLGQTLIGTRVITVSLHIEMF